MPMAHAYYRKQRSGELRFEASPGKQFSKFCLENTQYKKVTQVVEQLSSKHEFKLQYFPKM
jgi:hypothetical protein